MRRLLVLLSVLVALALFVPSLVVAQTGTPEPAVTALARTDARYVLPFGPDGVKAALTVSETISGSCTPHSLAAPYRPDVWDCIGGDQIYDPCFENPFVTEDAAIEVICMATPFTTEVTLLAVDGPLLREMETPPDQALFHPWDLPWGLELANGERCVLLHDISVTLAGETVHYDCENGGTVLGEVDRTLPVWIVNYLAPDEVTSSQVNVTAAWS